MLHNIKRKEEIGTQGFNCTEDFFRFLWEDSEVLGFLASIEDVVKYCRLGCLWELQVT